MYQGFEKAAFWGLRGPLQGPFTSKKHPFAMPGRYVFLK